MIVTFCGALVELREVFGKVIEVGDTVTAATPVPERAMTCGLLLALSVTVRVPLLDPRLAGVKVSLIRQLAPLASFAGLTGQLPPLCAKLPVTAILVIVKATV